MEKMDVTRLVSEIDRATANAEHVHSVTVDRVLGVLCARLAVSTNITPKQWSRLLLKVEAMIRRYERETDGRVIACLYPANTAPTKWMAVSARLSRRYPDDQGAGT
jgi:hypothetical protein